MMALFPLHNASIPAKVEFQPFLQTHTFFWNDLLFRASISSLQETTMCAMHVLRQVLNEYKLEEIDFYTIDQRSNLHGFKPRTNHCSLPRKLQIYWQYDPAIV
jgi:hypothetical protein